MYINSYGTFLSCLFSWNNTNIKILQLKDRAYLKEKFWFPFSKITNSFNPLFKATALALDFNQSTAFDILKGKVIEEGKLIFHHVSEFTIYVILLHSPGNLREVE